MGEKVLIVDDDDKLRKLLKEYLGGYGYQVRTLSDGSGVLQKLQEDSSDIVILDVMLTAKGEDADRIVGLEMGADDYLPKPFNPRELLARIKAVMRRIAPDEERESEGDEGIRISAGSLVLNKAKQTVLVEGNEMELSSTEFKILKALMERPNTILSRDQLMTLARGRDFMAFDRSIDVHISKLRAKVETDPGSPKRIKTIWGTGYMFVDTP